VDVFDEDEKEKGVKRGYNAMYYCYSLLLLLFICLVLFV